MKIGKGASNVASVFLRIATIIAGAVALTACATSYDEAAQEFAAYGYLTPGPTSEPELIGVYPSETQCKEAADNWASRQVVGNPVLAECYPVDKN